MTGKTWEEIEHSRKPYVSSEAVERAKELIDKDDTLNDHEKILALDDFKKNGFISKSCSNMINTTSYVTELGDFSEKELTNEELLSQIKVDHLTFNNKMMF